MVSTSQTVILASASPRRRELLKYLDIAFECISTDAEEEEHAPEDVVAVLPPLDVPVHDHPVLRAWRKAHAVCIAGYEGVIIGADTIVVIDGEVLNKPRDRRDAQRMLRRLAGRTHVVHTGLALLNATRVPRWSFELVSSTVEIAAISDTIIDAYIATGEPLDKAGSYGIQGMGGQLVRSVRGSYTGVVGFPLVAVHEILTSAGLTGLRDPAGAYVSWLRDQGKEPLPCPPTTP